MSRIVLSFLALFLLTATAQAYTTYRTVEGPVTIYFGEPGSVAKDALIDEIDKPLSIKATIENASDKPVSFKLNFRTIETFEFLGTEPDSKDMLKQEAEVPAQGKKTVEVKVVARQGTYTAHYPVHLDVEYELDGTPMRTNIVLVVETKVPGGGTPKNPQLGQTVENWKQLPLNTVPEHGGLFLATLNTYRGVWNHDNKPVQILPVGFSGAVETSRFHLSSQNTQRSGVYRQSFNMHPPYHGGIGNGGAEFRISLPKTSPITLSFYSAVRDTVPPESPSDGVTFRVLVDGEKTYEKHNAETGWVENIVDLSRYSGREVLLRLESDPGPKRNTNCDSCYWGDPMIFSGSPLPMLSPEEKQKLFTENLDAVKAGKSVSEKTTIYRLDGGLTAAVTFGRNGFVDGVIGLGNAEHQVQFDGLKVWSKGQPIGVWPSAVGVGSWVSETDNAAGAPPKPETKGKKIATKTDEKSFAQEITIEGRKGTLFFGLSKNGPAVQFRIDSSEVDLIDRIEFGPATHHANRVYYGHGYCIEEPEAFTANAGGHNLSTSHVGMDFENGISVLQASSFPVDRFIVDPKSKRYTLGVHPATTVTLLPGLNGAMDCAIRYRPICEYQAASGVKEKAGRFVFDVWGGRYKEHLETLHHAVKYGLADSLFIVHNWQRWGYDNRLPDIWPPNPRWGTLAEMQETLKFADRHGIQYGVHDNYIDFYPDAEDYSFDVTTFHANGQPRKAWMNYGIEAQSYQFRPDQAQRFLERNLDMMVPELPMSTYFVDVFTSAPPFDYFDREGNFHSRTETQACWNKAFDTIRDRLSKANKNFRSATTISEAGMDSLIGHLDGADCQFMFLSAEPGQFRIGVKCKSWSRVPWFDAVHHTTFSQHGVGYSGRYEAQRGRAIHGIESDDYISAEVLTGHALMVDWGSARRGAVRKYWLAQDLIRNLADKNITNVEFVDGNIDHQKITWNDGTVILVNLGKDDWTDWAKVLPEKISFKCSIPQYGFIAGKMNAIACLIVRKDDRVIEMAENHERETDVFVNARQKGIERLEPTGPKLNSFEYLGENRFKADFAWNTTGQISKDLCLFVHGAERQRVWHHKIKDAVLGGGYPKTPTSRWKGNVVTEPHTMTVPDDLPDGKYYLLVGLYDQKGNGGRARLMGFDTGADRYAVCWINVKRKDGKVVGISTEPIEWDDAHLYERLLPPEEPVDFGICKTKGAFRIEISEPKKTATVTPLPEEPDTWLFLRLDSQAKSVKAVDAEGKVLRDVEFQVQESGDKVPGRHAVVFMSKAGEFSYQICW